MVEDNRLSKVEILIDQKKYVQAEKILMDLLAEDSTNIHFLALLSQVNLQQEKFSAAKDFIDNAIGLSPDFPHLFYIKSLIAIHQDDHKEGEKNIKQAIELDPYNADYFAMYANLMLSRKKFENALAYANKALEIDPENLLGLNTRSTALLKLNKSEESFETIRGALREDPNNAYTHANYGWGLLENGDHKKSLEHFKESLKADPNFEYAQSGMIEALKANNPVYKLFTRYSFWMSNLTAKYQWGVIIGFYILFNILKNVARNNEALQPYLIPVIVALAIFAFSTWVINPIGNLFLRFNQYGQVLLSKNEKMSSNFVAVSFAVFVMGVTLYIVLADERFLTLAAFGFAMMLPYSVMFSPSKYKHSLLIYAIFMTFIGLVAILITFTGGPLVNFISFIFILSFILFQWVANFLLMQESDR